VHEVAWIWNFFTPEASFASEALMFWIEDIDRRDHASTLWPASKWSPSKSSSRSRRTASASDRTP
jgi:hypothetical protein